MMIFDGIEMTIQNSNHTIMYFNTSLLGTVSFNGLKIFIDFFQIFDLLLYFVFMFTFISL